MTSSTTPRTPARPVLMVLTSHGTKGTTGEATGFYLGELTHPLAELEAAGIAYELASIQGGEPPVDGLDLGDAVNARYWNDDAFRAALRQTQRLGAVDASRYAEISDESWEHHMRGPHMDDFRATADPLIGAFELLHLKQVA